MQNEVKCTHQAVLEKKNAENQALRNKVDALKLQLFAYLYGAVVLIPIDTTIRVGSVVRLKTGGPEMTVIDVDAGEEDEDTLVTAMLFDSEGCPHELELPAQCWAVKVVIA